MFSAAGSSLRCIQGEYQINDTFEYLYPAMLTVWPQFSLFEEGL
jgi:hypothetical protein